MADERTKAIDLAFAQIEKQFGKGSIMRLGSKEDRTHRRNSYRRHFFRRSAGRGRLPARARG